MFDHVWPSFPAKRSLKFHKEAAKMQAREASNLPKLQLSNGKRATGQRERDNGPAIIEPILQTSAVWKCLYVPTCQTVLVSLA